MTQSDLPQTHNQLHLRRQFIILAAISFLIAFNYYIVRSLKDALLVTEPGAGAEAIPFIKVWLLLPASFLFAMGFSWLSRHFSLRTTFTAVMSFFILSFAVFAFVFFPFRDSLHPTQFADTLAEILPDGWLALAAIVRYWLYAYFYVLAECWSPIVYSVLFWGFANEMTKMSNARAYYPFLTLAGTLAALFAGPVAIYLSSEAYHPQWFIGSTPWEQTLYALTLILIGNCLGAVILFFFVCPTRAKVARDPGRQQQRFSQFLKYFFRSKHLAAIALVTLTYNMMITLSEVVWKNEVVKVYSTPSEFNMYVNYVTIGTGILATLITLMITRPALRFLGWTKSALITPLLAMVTSGLFFSALIANQFGGAIVPHALAALLGSFHVCFSCSSKYTLFDTTKEMAFIPLDSHDKLQGKAAIDGVGSRLGKAGSSLFIQMLLILLPSISACVPIIAVLLFCSLLVCVRAVIALGSRMEPHLQIT